MFKNTRLSHTSQSTVNANQLNSTQLNSTRLYQTECSQRHHLIHLRPLICDMNFKPLESDARKRVPKLRDLPFWCLYQLVRFEEKNLRQQANMSHFAPISLHLPSFCCNSQTCLVCSYLQAPAWGDHATPLLVSSSASLLLPIEQRTIHCQILCKQIQVKLESEFHKQPF